MSDIAIRVENLGKMYRIGAQERRPDNLWHAARQLAASPFEYLRRITRPPTEEETLWALRDVSFEVKRGEVIGVIGRNGAGKSTLLKILSRITEPTHGRAEIHGRVGSLLEVGTGFHPELTGRENIYLNGAILGMKRTEIDCKFDEIVAFSDIERFLDTPVKRYSSGMYVRLAFAVAAHLEPEILLVDEVLAVGDAAFQKKALGKMGDVVNEGRTVLFVSHNLPSVESLCQQVIWLHNGKLRGFGLSRNVIGAYFADVAEDRFYRKIKYETSVLKGIFLLNNQGHPTDIVLAGEPLRIVLQIDDPSFSLNTPVLGIGVNTLLGERLFTVGTYFSNSELTPLSRSWSVVCEIPELTLVPGQYSMKVALGNGGIRNLLEIDDVLQFQVIAGDFFGTGRLPNATQGHFLVQSKWGILA